jgi:hypothetical protein
MPRVGFEPTIPGFEWAKIFRALDRAATGNRVFYSVCVCVCVCVCIYIYTLVYTKSWKYYGCCTHFFINLALDHLFPSTQPQPFLECTSKSFEESSRILYHS